MSYVNWSNKENGVDIADVNEINEAFASIEKSFSSAETTYSTKNELEAVRTTAEEAQATADRADSYVTQAQSTADYAAQGVDALNSDLNSGSFIVQTAYNADKAAMDQNGSFIHETYATKAEVGEIETALDAILEIQNSLIEKGE